MQVKSINTVITVVIAAVIVITVAAAVVWTTGSTRSAVVGDQTVAMDNMVKQTMAALDDYIEQTQDTAAMLASQQAVVTAAQGFDSYAASSMFKQLIKSSEGYWAAFVFDAQGKVVAGYNAKGKDMAGADRSSRGYVKAVMSGKTAAYLDDNILISKSGGGIMIFAVAHAVKDEAGNVIGGVGIFPKWEGFTGKFIDPFRVAENGYGYMLDSKGRIIAHAVNKKLYLKDLSKYDFVQTALTEKNGFTEYDWEGREKIMVFETLPKTGWVMVMSAYEADLAAAAIAQRNVLAVGGIVVALLLICIVVVAIRRLVTGPVDGILGFATEVAEGNLHAKLDGTYRFEFESMAEQIETMVAELKNKLGFSEGVLKGMSLPCGLIDPDNKISWVNEEFLELLERSGSPEDHLGMVSGEFYFHDKSKKTLADTALAAQETQTAEIEFVTVNGNEKNIQITATPFFDMDGKLLGAMSIWLDVTDIRQQQKMIEEQNARIANAATEAEEISQYLSSAAEELSAQIEQASRGSEVQRERASETATAMEEMNATVLEVAQNASLAAEGADTAKDNAESGEKIVSEVINAVGDVQSQADNLKSSMEGLGHQAADIGNVLEVITDIADQTNLLALNAAIEAARAGEAGRGFAVVADEVRKLAEKTMSATSEVGEAISKIQSMTEDNVTASEVAAKSVQQSTALANSSGEALREIVGQVENAADQVRAIATAAEQQSATSEEINRATEEINRISMETSQVMMEAAKAIQEVAAMASKLNAVIEEMSVKE